MRHEQSTPFTRFGPSEPQVPLPRVPGQRALASKYRPPKQSSGSLPEFPVAGGGGGGVLCSTFAAGFSRVWFGSPRFSACVCTCVCMLHKELGRPREEGRRREWTVYSLILVRARL